MSPASSPRLTEQEVMREARRILRRLKGRNALHAVGGDRFAVARQRDAAAQSRVAVEGMYVRAFLLQNWIASDGPGRFVIAQAGMDLLVRQDRGEEGFAAQHRLDAGAGAATVNAAESPLARLAFRQLIDPVQLAAGDKLRRDFTLAQMTPRMGVDLSAPAVSGRRGPGADHISDTALAAKQRFSRAMQAVGPDLADLLFDICCHLSTLEHAETRRSWSRRSGRVVLGIALDRLADHYGLRMTAPRRSGLRGWRWEEGEAAAR